MQYAMAQMNPTTGDIAGNTAQIVEALESAEERGADVAVFPEAAITGYCASDLFEDDAFVAANRDALDEIADYTDDMAAVVGFIDRDGEDRYNAAAVLQDGEVDEMVHKQLLPTYRYFDDDRYFTAGEQTGPVDVTVDGETVSLGVSICEDMWDKDYDERPVSALVEQGADIIVNINASPFAAGKREERQDRIEHHVDQHDVPFLYVNTVGVADVGSTVLPFDGDSLAYAGSGEVIGHGARFDEDLVMVDPDRDGRVDIQGTPREAELYDALVFALQDYADKTGFDHAIQPVSGGIDSALGLAITADAFGPDNVSAYNLPSTVNSEETRDRAARLADNLGVDYTVMPVQSLYDAALDTFETAEHPVEDTVARENVYARLRGMLMMLASNEDGGLLVSNGNETELALGYATLYGDMTGGLSLLGDLSKTDVYDVARHVNERHGEKVIPDAIIDAEPSAELSPGQEDPFDYDVVAPLVSAILEDRVGPRELMDRYDAGALDRFPADVYDDRDTFEDTVHDTFTRFRDAAFKRVQAPPVIAVSDRSFGTDFREPIINDWDGDWSSERAGGDTDADR